MLYQGLIFLAGLFILYYGAEWLIKGATGIALSYGIRPLVVGLTVVALGTSMPEFVVNFFAALSNQDSLALGNILGSNIANIGLILATSSVVIPLAVAPLMIRREYPIMLGVSILFFLLALDGTIGKIDGVILLFGLGGFLFYLIQDSRRYRSNQDPVEAEVEAEAVPVWKRIAILLAGIALLAGGARLMVLAAVSIADRMGIDPVVIGLTVVAIGTSLPELAASMLSAIRGEADLSVGNVIGSNLLNVLFVIGLVAMVRPLSVDSESLTIHFPVMLGFSVVLLPLMWTGHRISRIEGLMLFVGFVGYLGYLVSPYL